MKFKIILAVIILLAALLRFYQLGQTPKGLYIDEPSLGYNAYSILKTGADEYGKKLPLAFQAYGEYKLPVYIYASVPVIQIFGLSAFSVRFLSALAGVLGVIGIYLLISQILAQTYTSSKKIALVGAFLWAISPWSMQLSRAAFESNVMLTLVIFANYFLLKYITSKKSISLIFSALCFILAFYTYNAARLFIPVFLIAILCIYRKSFSKISTILFVAVLVLSFLPAITGIVSGKEGTRLQQVFELDNKEYMLGPVLGVVQKYFVHFSPDFLFFKGDITTPRHSVNEFGMLYFPEIVTIILGTITILKSKVSYRAFILTWLLIAPLPAALASPVPHALRTVLMLPSLIILSSLGMYTIYQYIKQTIPKLALQKFTYLILIFFFSYSVFTYLHVYYQHYKYRTSWDWNEDKTRLAEYLASQNYPENQKYIVEAGNIDMIYFKFFNAAYNKPFNETNYLFISGQSSVVPQNGDIVAISGWKGTPDQLKDAKELTMYNKSIGYKVGVWQAE